MGSWSEACTLAGLPIHAGRSCYMSFMQRKSYEGWVIQTLPVKGTYDSYGGLEEHPDKVVEKAKAEIEELENE